MEGKGVKANVYSFFEERAKQTQNTTNRSDKHHAAFLQCFL
jgi:hypothetical protein